MKASPERPASGEVLAPDHVRLRLTIAYDGTAYAGWQRQPNASTVQQRIEEAFGKIFTATPVVSGSSRTDTGVHAAGLVAHVDIPKRKLRMPLRKLVLALNAWLPEDVRVLAVVRARDDFHARFSARGKQYRYYVWNHAAHSPLWRRQSWHVPRPLDLAVMKQAARELEGRHDFLAFSASPGYARRVTIRHVTRCTIQRAGPLLTFVIEADGFLYKMCRGIVGTLVQVGLGRFAPDSITPMLKSRDRTVAGMTAPAHGLVLWKVFYAGSGEPSHRGIRLAAETTELE
ncbi:MAG TPA: tRNA pseudouridine(38-40) synthase TruA [Verrucomicrobiota bacterium]|nr:tRNA pseudouridine(38-40) synthase TruA [Verrucomicrobiales bacterium]HRI12606.1 tRNA pseudouridine(38-40) synthase TruA [Verrucomicrobiota bacterium]